MIDLVKRIISACCAAMILVAMLLTVAYASAWNYATSTERMQLYYDVYVQIKSSFNENGQHAARGYIRYRNGVPADTGRLYTAYGNSASDSAIHSKSYTYTDSLDPFAAKVAFNYGFTWVPHGSPDWPV